MLIADSHIPRTHQSSEPTVSVAVGVLFRESDGSFLMTTRPFGKVYAGYWEFPGGKIEKSESVFSALSRELEEEIGIHVPPESIVAWREIRVDYPHAVVCLHICKVTEWVGAMQMKEGQDFAWEQMPVKVFPILPGALPILDWLEQSN